MTHPTKANALPKRSLLLMPLALLGLAACDSPEWSDAENLNSEAGATFERNNATYQNTQDTGRPSNINVERGLFLANQGFRSGRGNPLPARFETNEGVTLNTAAPVNIEEFAQIVEQMTGIRVDYEDLRLVGANAGGGAASADTGEADATGAVNIGALVAQAQSTTVGPTERTFRIRHTGKLSTVLDTVASRLAADWVYEGGRIVFKGPQTITYTIWAFPGQSATSGAVGGGANAFGSGQAANTTRSASYDYWAGVESSIQALIPPTIGSFTANPSTGSITVTGNQAIHLRVQDFIENENRRVSRQVAVRIDVIALTQDRSNNINLGATAAIEQMFSSNRNGFQVGVATGGGVGINLNRPSDNFAVGIEALAEYGQVSVVQSQTVTAMNNTPTPISITNERAYVQSVTVGTDEEPPTVTPGIINSGINFVVTPRIMSSNDVVLQYTLNMSELVEIREFGAGGNAVQLPEMASRNISQTVNLRSGETVVIGSSQTQEAGTTRTGAFTPSFWGLGGGREATLTGTQILILMTPVVLEGSNTPRGQN
jgi:type IVB pilus formation R64 PilN family outer membrane protein